MFTRLGLLQVWKETRPYFIFALILFFAGLVAGLSSDAPAAFLEQQLSQLADIVNKVKASDRPEWTLFWALLGNNMLATFMAMSLGLFFGVFPVYMLVFNGMVLGYVLSRTPEGQNVWLLVVKGILPHGVIELTAVFLAGAFGVRFGWTLIRGIAGSAFGRTEPWRPFVRTAIGAVPALIAIAVLLVLAAVIESTITYWIAV